MVRVERLNGPEHVGRSIGRRHDLPGVAAVLGPHDGSIIDSIVEPAAGAQITIGFTTSTTIRVFGEPVGKSARTVAA